jgi:hypothetical protein
MPRDGAEEAGLAKRAGQRGKARARPQGEAGGDAEQPVARILQLVAALKAEQESPAPAAPARDPAERVKLMGWLRRILDAREQERQAWQAQIRGLEAQIAQAQAAAERTSLQQERLVTDLKLMHEHQRSIWELERRRLEITIEGLERARQKTLLGRAARLARPALAASLVLGSLAALALSADSVSVADRARLHIDDTSRATVIVLGVAPAGSASP